MLVLNFLCPQTLIHYYIVGLEDNKKLRINLGKKKYNLNLILTCNMYNHEYIGTFMYMLQYNKFIEWNGNILQWNLY